MRAAPVLSLLAILVASACGASYDRPSSRQDSMMKMDSSRTFTSGKSSSQAQPISNSFNSPSSVAASPSKVLNTNTVVTVTATEDATEDSTVDTTEDSEDTTEDTEDTTEDTTEDSEDTTEDTTEESSDDSTEDSYVQALLVAHNEYRVLHGVANLTLNSTLSAYALEWAEYLSENSLFQHRTDPIYGENLYWSSAETTAQSAADAWYSEVSDYTDYTCEPDLTSFSSGHYTQMVWKGSEQLGCASVTATSGAMYVVCNYNPPGNYVGEFVANVLAPSS